MPGLDVIGIYGPNYMYYVNIKRPMAATSVSLDVVDFRGVDEYLSLICRHAVLLFDCSGAAVGRSGCVARSREAAVWWHVWGRQWSKGEGYQGREAANTARREETVDSLWAVHNSGSVKCKITPQHYSNIPLTF
jgi:hypothetical protein